MLEVRLLLSDDARSSLMPTTNLFLHQDNNIPAERFVSMQVAHKVRRRKRVVTTFETQLCTSDFFRTSLVDGMISLSSVLL